MAGKSKIIKHGLDTRVQELAARGSSAAEIHRVLLQENPGLELHESSVGRYLSKCKESAIQRSFETIKDHVDRVVPADLNALEELEAQALSWSREAAPTAAERAVIAAEKLSAEIEWWAQKLVSFSQQSESAEDVARQLIRRAAFLLAEDDRRQEARLKAMRMAVQIIDLKLRQAGLLDPETKGRIVIMKSNESMEDGDDDGSTTIRFPVVEGGADG